MWNIEEIKSEDTRVLKYVFTKEDAVAESVLYQYPTYQDRTVICCSTMSGCPVGCRFCGAGDNFVRSLTTDEIVSQPQYLLEKNNIDVPNVNRLQIMFMSMGEPLLNLPNLIPALDRLYKMYPNAALLISTSAPRADYLAVRNISIDIPTIGLQFSIHESTDKNRNILIPFKSKLTLNEIAKEGELWYQATGRQPFFNYCVHAKNNSDEDIERLVSIFNKDIWQATISVICERDEYLQCERDKLEGESPTQKTLASEFLNKIIAVGYSARMFDPAGQSAGGGCGQLFYTQRWITDNPNKAHKSIGTNKPILHMPI